MQLKETIAAISTPPGKGGIGIVRISGDQALSIAQASLRGFSQPQARQATLCQLIDGERTVDQVLATWFAAPHSFTGEHTVEIACHGAPVILRFCLEQVIRQGARLAQPGEFTLRAYLNGRLELPQAEAVRDLIEATTLHQAKIAAQQLGGALRKRIDPLKKQLVDLISLLEAGIDFAEDDVEVAPPAELLRRWESIDAGLRSLARSYQYGQIVHAGFSLAIVGKPNVGKSSLFNALLEQDRALVTEIPGTTRDLVAETAAIEGIPVRLMDTAGIREASDRVEILGIERSHQAMADADLVLVVYAALEGLDEETRGLFEKAQAQGRCLLVANKLDLGGKGESGALGVSAASGEGIPELRRRIVESFAPGGAREAEAGLITSLRQKLHLDAALENLDRARVAIEENVPHEMLLLDLYAALRAVDEVSGATTADDILNQIFSTFCIGK